MKTSQLYSYLVAGVCASAVGADQVSVLGNGVEYIGVQNKTSGMNSYYGIKYAMAPVGDLRWRAPVRISNSAHPETATINATVPSDGCIQSIPVWLTTGGSSFGDSRFVAPVPQGSSEDCLALNIHVPTEPVSDKLPVMVNIHGGGYTMGNAADNPPNTILHHSKGSMIMVAIQYRIGAYGFLAGDEVQADGTANAGLLDQRAALEWVRRNIETFGGDPEKVTVTGISGGGGSTAMQMVLFGGDENPPFRATMPEATWLTPIYDRDWQNAQYNRFLQSSNCTDLDCLRGLSADALLHASNLAYVSAYEAGEYGQGTFYFGPAIDNVTLRDHPMAEFYNGHFTKVPMLINHGGDEGFMFTNQSIATAQDSVSFLKPFFQDSDGSYIDAARKLYPVSEYNKTLVEQHTVRQLQAAAGVAMNVTDEFSRTSFIFGDAIVACPTTFISTAVSAAGLDVYRMAFDAGTQYHGPTVPYLYEEDLNADGATAQDGVRTPGNATLAQYMKDWFVSFVTDLDPNNFGNGPTTAPEFPVYNETSKNTLYITDTDIQSVHDPWNTPQCKFLGMGRGNGERIWPQW